MKARVSFVVVPLVVAAFAHTLWGGVADESVMGNWEGGWYGETFGGGKASAQIIAEGNGNYMAVISVDIGEAQLIRGEIRGKLEGDKAVFEGEIDVGAENGGIHKVTGEISDGKFSGRYTGESSGTFELKRIQKVPPTLGLKAPEGAIVLFDGKDMLKWERTDGGPSPWRLVEGAMEVVPDKGSIRTKDEFRDFKLHVEFCVPFLPNERGQARGNSGVYVPGNNEIQVLDSFGLPLSKYDCGAFYGQAAPLANACLPPGEWQTYDVTFIAPRFDEKGKPVKSATITVFHNGTKIHDQFQPKRMGAKSGRILLQDHGNRVRYRNVWLLPLSAD